MTIQNKQKTLLIYTVLYRLFLLLLVAGLLSFLVGLITGMSGWVIGYTLSVLGFLLALLIMPFYFIYRTRFKKARLTLYMREHYKNEQM